MHGCAGFTYVFLLDQAQYLNHFYLVSLVAFLMCFLPAARGWSLDAWFHQRADPWVPRWTQWMLLLQFEVMYIFAGLVKVNGDWLRLEPLRSWLQSRADQVWFGAIFQHDWVIALGAYGSVLLHLVGAPLLLWRPARPYVFALYVLLHPSNHTLFNIGIFPWLAIVGTLLFFGPAWPRRLLGWLARGHGASGRWPILPPPAPAGVRDAERYRAGRRTHPGRGMGRAPGSRAAAASPRPGERELARAGPSLRLANEVAANPRRCPVRHQRSANRTGLDGKPDRTPLAQAGKVHGCMPGHGAAVCPSSGAPMEGYGVPAPEVRVEGWKSLNGREPEPLVDPDRDLMEVPRSLGNADWILAMSAPLPPRVRAGAEEDYAD